ncbi:MAG: hypothetical protein LLF97_08965 [Planctomycetaceae bacterium]|nr:hypothetical protein [Planctomycetaceae bacterium]
MMPIDRDLTELLTQIGFLAVEEGMHDEAAAIFEAVESARPEHERLWIDRLLDEPEYRPVRDRNERQWTAFRESLRRKHAWQQDG